MKPSSLFGLAVVAALSPACRKHSENEGSSAEVPSSIPPPVDRLAHGELLPGTEEAFGLVLPRGLRISASFPGATHATGDLKPEDVANYVRTRVDVQRVELGAVGTVFNAVHIRGGDPNKVLRIEVNEAGGRTELVVRDVTPLPKVPVDPTVPEAERWRRAGYHPDGTPLDPMSLH